MEERKQVYSRSNIQRGITSFLLVLLTMPLGHALMILMESFLPDSQLTPAAFIMGLIGIGVMIGGIFAQKDITRTLFGFFGALLFWTGWIEFGYVYFAKRLSVVPLTDSAGEVLTKPEYLLMPSSGGFLILFFIVYLFSVRSGCDFFNYIQQRLLHRTIKKEALPQMRNSSVVTFMETNLLLWTSYLVLLFCYDDQILGDRHPITGLIAFGCLFVSMIMFGRLLKIGSLGGSVRFAIPTVVIFWTFVEVMGRWNLLHEIWVHPFHYWKEMLYFLLMLIGALFFLLKSSRVRHK